VVSKDTRAAAPARHQHPGSSIHSMEMILPLPEQLLAAVTGLEQTEDGSLGQQAVSYSPRGPATGSSGF